MEDFKRKENETDFAYKYRLIMGKSNKIEPYVDLEWQDIVELLGINQHRDTLRKRGDAWKELMDHSDEIGLSNSDEEQLLKIKKEKVKLSDLKTETNKQIRNLARVENMTELLKENIDALGKVKPIVSNDYFFLESDTEDITHAVLMASDWHFGLEVNNHLNKFNTEICVQRVNQLIEKTIKHCKTQNVKCLHLFFLGDLISGNIRNIIRLQNREDVSSQIIQVSELIVEMIAKLSYEIPYVTISFCLGNHERSIDKKENCLEVDNYLPLIKSFVQLRVKDLKNVVVNDNKYGDWVIVENILGYKFVGTHGHYVKKDKANYQLSNIIGTDVDYICLGHFHQNMSLTEYESQTFINSSLIGSDEYSKSLMLHTFPSQKLLIVNEEGVFAEYTIKLKD